MRPVCARLHEQSIAYFKDDLTRPKALEISAALRNMEAKPPAKSILATEFTEFIERIKETPHALSALSRRAQVPGSAGIVWVSLGMPAKEG